MEPNKSNILFSAISPLNNVKVILTQNRFDEHIAVNHPEMKGHEKDIKETIERPNAIYEAKRFPEKRKHYIRKTHKNEISEYNNVIIEYDTEQNAHVTTSYYSEELEGGGNYVYFNFNNKL